MLGAAEKFLLPDSLTRFLVQALVVIASARLIGLVVRRIGQPMVIAEIVAGILLGPSLLGWLAPEVSLAVFPKESLATLQLVSQLGLVLFMFLVGLELDPAMLKGRAHTSIAISQTSIVVPFALGALLAFGIYDGHAPPGIGLAPFLLFLGVAMSITAFPVLARILTERRLLKTRVGAVAIACAAVDDVSAWCILAFVVAVTRSHGVESALFTTVGAFVFIALMLFALRPLAKRIGAKYTTAESVTQNVVAVIVGLVLVSSWVTELIGIHALFGAFLFGTIMPKGGTFARLLAEKLEDVVTVVLLPLFFAVSGLRTNIGLLDSPSAWGLCALIITLATVGKFGGSFIAARLTGLPWRDAGAIGVLMNTRGLVELIVLNIGLELGVITPTLFSMLVIMALVTTFATTPILRIVYPPKFYIFESEPAAPPPGYAVLAYVGDEHSGPGLARVAAGLRARVHALHLIAPSERGSVLMADMAGDPERDDALARFSEHARALSLENDTRAFVSADMVGDLVRAAREQRPDLVLLGGQKPLLGASSLGGVVQDVLRESRAQVAVLLDQGLTQIKKVLVPQIGAPNDDAALALARRLGAELIELAVSGPDAFEAVIQEAAKGYDLVVVGYDRAWGFADRLLPLPWSSEPLVRAAPTSLLVVRAAREATAPVPVMEPAPRL